MRDIWHDVAQTMPHLAVSSLDRLRATKMARLGTPHCGNKIRASVRLALRGIAVSEVRHSHHRRLSLWLTSSINADQSTALHPDPRYPQSCFTRVTDRTSRRRLRSSASLWSRSTARSTLYSRQTGVPIAGANMWNDLPFHITSAQSLAVFRQRQKTFLFSHHHHHHHRTCAYYKKDIGALQSYNFYLFY